MRAWLRFEIYLLSVHLVNSVSNVLGQDVVSRTLRRAVLRAMGVRIGPGSVIDGGGYIYGGHLTVGKRCYVNRACYFDLTAPVVLGDEVEVGHGVTFITATHQLGPTSRRAGQVSGRPIDIGPGTWIGANATILPGVRIGRGSIVTAGAVVARDVGDNVVVAGVPARPMRDLASTQEDLEFTKDTLRV